MLLTISPWLVVMIVLIVVMIAAIVALYIFGNKQQKKQAEQKEQLASMAQQQTMLIIDKKKLKIKKSGLPQAVIDQAPWYSRNAKLPIVRARVGGKTMSLIADEEVFDLIPLKKEVKATVSGLYITGVRGVHGKIEAPPKKKTFRDKMRDKYNNYSAQQQADQKAKEAKKSGKKKK